MNELSLAHSNEQNQASWIDGAFQFETNFIKGMRPMSHKRRLSDYAEELVYTHAKCEKGQYELFLDMLTDEEQNELVRLYIESIDREIEWACQGGDESINSDFLCAMLAMFKDDNEETRAKFAEVTRRNTLSYYTEALNDVLVTACEHFYYSHMEESMNNSYDDEENRFSYASK